MAGPVQFKRRDIVVIMGYAITLMALYAVTHRVAPLHAVAVTIIAAGAGLLAIALATHHKTMATLYSLHRTAAVTRRQDFHHLEALLSLVQILQPVAPISTTRGWAAAPDFLKLIAETVLQEKPAFVVEASSGTSTLVIAYCLKRLGAGKVIALEHDRTYAERTRQVIALHELDDFAQVIHAPLVETTLQGTPWQWYDTKLLPPIPLIDLVIVDGPPGTTQKEARYPALPLLMDRLAPHATLLLDDARRSDEQALVQRWLNEYPQFKAEFIELEKGAYIVTTGA